MGLFDLFKNNNKEKKNITISAKSNIKNLAEDLFNYKKVKYTKEQVIALFLRSMSYRPQKVGNSNDDYPRYLVYDYNIFNVPLFHKSLINKGFFCKASFKNIINQYKVAELKEILNSKKQSFKNLKKPELIELTINVFSDEEKQKLEKHSDLYVLSQKGLEYLKEYDCFFEILEFEKYNINYPLFMKYKNKLPSHLTNRDVAWKILNDRLNFYSINNEFSEVRFTYLDMAKFLKEEKTNIDVLYYYILIIYYDINLKHTQGQMLEKILNSDKILEYIDEIPLAGGIAREINFLSEYHNDKIFEKLFSFNHLPYKFISDNEFKDMILNIYESPFFEEQKYVDIATKNAKRIIKSKKY